MDHLRVIIAARKSRKGDNSAEATHYARQEDTARRVAQTEGHFIVHTTRDTVSSQTMPWERRELKAWMTDPDKLGQWDAMLVETDRLARVDDERWHFIESWLYEHGKILITVPGGVRFPARDDSDRYQWVGLKRAARTEWEATRNKHADARRIARERGSAYGKALYGYESAGERLGKSWVPVEPHKSILTDIYERVAAGESAKHVAEWYTETYSHPRRSKWVTDLIRNRKYVTGEADWWTFEPIVNAELWERANAALDARSFHRPDKGGERVTWAYSSVIYCPCGAAYHHHQSSRRGLPVGQPKYRCSRGRSNNPGELPCDNRPLPYELANEAVDAEMRSNGNYEIIAEVRGGDAARKSDLARIDAAMQRAMKDGNMDEVVTLAGERKQVEATEPEPIRMTGHATGRTWGDMWRAGDLDARRDILRMVHVVVGYQDGKVVAECLYDD